MTEFDPDSSDVSPKGRKPRGTSTERPRVSFIDLRGSLSNQEWYDQLFPTNEGFKKLADAVKTHILQSARAASD